MQPHILGLPDRPASNQRFGTGLRSVILTFGDAESIEEGILSTTPGAANRRRSGVCGHLNLIHILRFPAYNLAHLAGHSYDHPS